MGTINNKNNMPYTKLPISNGNVLCYSAVGKITQEDYTNNLVPVILDTAKQYGKVRMLVNISDFHLRDMTWTAMWEDAKLGLTKSEVFDRCAIVCKHSSLMNVFSKLFQGLELKSFETKNLSEAIQWIFDQSGFSPCEVQLDSPAKELSIPFLHTTKFLVAVDSGPACKRAVGHALNLLKCDSNEELHLVTVVSNKDDVDRLAQAIEDVASEIVDMIGPRTDDCHLSVFQHIEQTEGKSVAATLIERAKQIKADYIIMGTDHAQGISSVFHSSVCQEVVKHSPCPVLVCLPTHV